MVKGHHTVFHSANIISPYFLVEVGVSVVGGTGTGTGGRGGVATSGLGVAKALSGWSLSTLSWYMTPSR